MVPAVAGAAVAVSPAGFIGGKHLFDGGEQVLGAAGSNFDDGQAGGGVRYEHRDQPVSPLGTEPEDAIGQIDDLGAIAGLD